MRSDWEVAAAFAVHRWPHVHAVIRATYCLCTHDGQLVRQLMHQHDRPVTFRVVLSDITGPAHFVKVERGKAAVYCHRSHAACHSKLRL